MSAEDNTLSGYAPLLLTLTTITLSPSNPRSTAYSFIRLPTKNVAATIRTIDIESWQRPAPQGVNTRDELTGRLPRLLSPW